MYRKYSEHLLSSFGKIYVSSNLPINRLAYGGAHLVPMDTTLVYRKFVLLNIKLLSVNMSLRNVVVIGVSCFIAEVFRKDMIAVQQFESVCLYTKILRPWQLIWLSVEDA